jgi:hypothetical protein
MSDPVRLRDDPAMSELLRKDLGIAKEHASVRYDVEAGLAALARKTGPGGGSSGGGPSLKTIGAVSTIAGAGVAIVIVAIVASRPNDEPPSEPRTEELAPPETPREVTEESPRAEVETTEVVEPEVAPVRQPVREADPPDPLAEAREIAEARRSLASDPAHTLAIVERHRRTYRPGLYREEREALAILALDRLGRSGAARPRAQRFLARFPASAFRERIERIAGASREGSDREGP